MKGKIPVLRVLLLLVCIVNLYLGVAAYTSRELTLKTINIVYGVPLTELAEHTWYIVKMAGCYVIAIAVMAGLAAFRPQENRIIILGNAIWLILRGLQRIVYVERFHTDWQVPYAQLWGQIVFVFLFAALLLLLMPRKLETT